MKRLFSSLHRQRLTQLLWKNRFAVGNVSMESLPGPRPPGDLPWPIMQQYEPVPRRMKDSHVEVLLPFRTDLLLREEYINYYKGLRLGKLMEDLDIVAASAAYKHCGGGEMDRSKDFPFIIVTAAVDRMDLLNALRPDLDMKISGNVSYVGRSSMEVSVSVESTNDSPPYDQWTPIIKSRFTMVAKSRDPKSFDRIELGRLIPESPEEQRLIASGEERKRRKLEMAKKDLRLEPPNAEERELVHRLWLERVGYGLDGAGQADRSIAIPKDIVLMQDTRQQIVRICHPQDRNIHSSIFGGYLMRESYELAYTTASLFMQGRPFAVASDEIVFKKPVSIGSILFLSSEVTLSQGHPHQTFQVSVTADVLKDLKSGRRECTNVFHYTFSRSNQSPPLKRIMPLTYGESMKLIEGLRRRQAGIEHRRFDGI